MLFTLVANKYERGSVMLTSNLQFSEWEKIFKYPMTTATAIDRLVHHSIILELNLRALNWKRLPIAHPLLSGLKKGGKIKKKKQGILIVSDRNNLLERKENMIQNRKSEV